MANKSIGIIGGMGPLATADLFQKIIENTDAATDQEHIPVIIDNNTAIPDRTAALLYRGADPFPMMLKSAKKLQSMGAELLIMPCVTGHSYLDALRRGINIPILNMLTITCETMVRGGVKKAALFATTGTVKTGIFDKVCSLYGIELLIPSDADQRAVMDVIYRGVKAGARDYDASAVNSAAQRLIESGADTVILGCTELPIAYMRYKLDFPHIDPTLELARKAIIISGARVKA